MATIGAGLVIPFTIGTAEEATGAGIHRAELYPAGTTVKVYVEPTPRPGEVTKRSGDPGAWLPAPTLLGEYTVASNGTLGLPLVPGTPYLCWAQVAGADAYLHARVRGLPPERF